MANQAAPTVSTLQGIEAPNFVVDPQTFYDATDRKTFTQKSQATYAGFGNTDIVTLRQDGIIYGLDIRVVGTVVFGGTITGTSMTYQWPYNLIQAVRVSANGQSNLINCGGLQLKARNFMDPDVSDRGVSRLMGGATVTQGTLSLASEDWGTSGVNQLGPGSTVAATGTYTVDLVIHVPIAADERTLVGALFAQTSSTNLTVEVQWNSQANLLTLGGSATVTANLAFSVLGQVCSIPVVGGRSVVPDLSVFHQLVSVPEYAISQGDNVVNLNSVTPGRKWMRSYFQTYSSGVPLAVTSANYGPIGWAYGASTTPDVFTNGTVLRQANERMFNTDFGGRWGFAVIDFASEFARRDMWDLARVTNLRLTPNLVSAPTTPRVEHVMESLFGAAAGA